MPKLYAISDLHVGFEENRALLGGVRGEPGDWLIVAGDVGETEEHMASTWELLGDRFDRLLWVPGNHELWIVRGDGREGSSVEKYERLVDLCRRHGVLTPEDPFARWEHEGGPCLVALTFTLYDYSFCPDDVGPDRAVAWAMEAGLRCADEDLIDPTPYPSLPAWCEARIRQTEACLAEASARAPLVIVNHFPLRHDLVTLPRIPRFSIWCGSRRTQQWHVRYRAKAVVSGHLHFRRTDWRDGVVFREVSLGYPRQWKFQAALQHGPIPQGLLCPVLP